MSEIINEALKEALAGDADDLTIFDKRADEPLITRRDSEDAVVMSLETFNAYMETFHLLRSPANAAHLLKSIEQYKEGSVQERKLINE